MTYQIRDWNRNFENNKSREIDQCSFVCLPNKQHGMGFRRIMAELDGATIYGIWVCIVAACSQQKTPRCGWLTEDGKKTGAAWTAMDIALKVGRPTAEIERCISVVSSPRVGWLAAVQVPVDCPPSADEVPAECPEGRKERTEGKKEEGRKEYLAARDIPPSLEMVTARAVSIGLAEREAIRFHAYYESNGWRVGKNPMKSWHAAMTNWSGGTAREATSGKPAFAPTTEQQIRSTRELLAAAQRRLDTMPKPSDLMTQQVYDAAKARRAPLIEEKKQLSARLNDLLREQAQGK